MGKMIVEFGGQYAEWSTVVDAPVTYLMTEEKLKQYLLARYGYENGLRDFENRMARVRKFGTSGHETKKELLRNNRAGEKESRIKTEEAMVAEYCWPSDREQGSSIDLNRPLELVDSHGYLQVRAPVVEILGTVETFTLARVKLAELESPVTILFDSRDGELLSKNFVGDFEIRNVP